MIFLISVQTSIGSPPPRVFFLASRCDTRLEYKGSYVLPGNENSLPYLTRGGGGRWFGDIVPGPHEATNGRYTGHFPSITLTSSGSQACIAKSHSRPAPASRFAPDENHPQPFDASIHHKVLRLHAFERRIKCTQSLLFPDGTHVTYGDPRIRGTALLQRDSREEVLARTPGRPALSSQREHMRSLDLWGYRTGILSSPYRTVIASYAQTTWATWARHSRWSGDRLAYDAT